jgi:two-component system response regulator AgrA
MLRFVLCDDCQKHNTTLELSLREIIDRYSLQAEIALVTTVPRAIIAFANQHTRDIVYFLDLELCSEMNGLDVAQAIRQHDANSYIVFISAHQEYLLDCYKSKASDFLIKPFLKERLEQCVLGILRDKQLMEREPMLLVSIGSCTYFLPHSGIFYFEKAREYVVAHWREGEIRWREKYDSLLDRLSSDAFMRIHHGFVVNLTHVKTFDSAKRILVISTGQWLPVSRGYLPSVERALRSVVDAQGI